MHTEKEKRVFTCYWYCVGMNTQLRYSSRNKQATRFPAHYMSVCNIIESSIIYVFSFNYISKLK